MPSPGLSITCSNNASALSKQVIYLSMWQPTLTQFLFVKREAAANVQYWNTRVVK